MKSLLLAISLLMTILGAVSAGELVDNSEKPFKVSKIVGGVKSFQGAWPSTVALLDANKINSVESGTALDVNGGVIPFAEANAHAQYCGASLIGSKWVLTAAHCVVDSLGVKVGGSRIKALVGTTDLLSGGERVSVNKIIVHPSYNNNNADADIALIELEYSVGIETIPVSSDDIPAGISATVVGWGALFEDESVYPYDLYEVQVPIISRARCIDLYGSNTFTSNMICAGHDVDVKDTCKGDSGGPLMAIQDGQLVQAGITSWGIGCAQPGKYGVYTRLSQFESWIDSTLNPPSNSPSSGGGSLFFLLLPLLIVVPVRKYLKRKGL